MSSLHVAAAQYPIEQLKDLASYEVKLARWVAQAAESGAQLLLFPEYGLLELASLFRQLGRDDRRASIEKLQDALSEVDALHAALARRHEVHILASSAPVRQIDGGFVNTARLFAPSGAVGSQEKLMPTRFEREHLGIDPGHGCFVFETTLGRLGIALGYDAEFPLLVRTLAEADARLILAPSCATTPDGYHGMRIACAARALENQCYVVQCAAIGQAPWPTPLNANFGAAGFFAPPGSEFSPDGAIARGEMNQPGWVHAQLDLDMLDRQRQGRETENFVHWSEQPGVPVLPQAEVVNLVSA